MADDLKQFFAKKSAKSRDKRTKKLKVEDVGHVLDRKARKQEESDRLDEGEERRLEIDEIHLDQRAEDSDWLEYRDGNKELNLEEMGIRDMNLIERAEEALEEEKIIGADAPKTWNTKDEASDANEVDTIPSLPVKPAIYRPKHILLAMANRPTIAPNINDQDMFPTFEAADKIEKLKKDDDKKKKVDLNPLLTDDDTKNPWISSGSGRRVSGGPARVIGNEKTGSSGVWKAATTARVVNLTAPQQQQEQVQPQKATYVPPALRREKALQKSH